MTSTTVASRNSIRDTTALAASLVLCFAVAGLGGYWTSLGLGPWYDGLRKPPWTPPNRVFGPVWTVLYASMAIAAWLVWRQRRTPPVALPLGLFGLQLALNLAWSGLFFALRRPGWAFGEILSRLGCGRPPPVRCAAGRLPASRGAVGLRGPLRRCPAQADRREDRADAPRDRPPNAAAASR